MTVVPLAIYASAEAGQTPRRIQSVVFNKAEVEKISLVPGLASVILFPCAIDEAVVGRAEELKVQISPTSKRQLTLSLVSYQSLPTNLVVRCGERRDPFVFDVVANLKVHQDVVKISAQMGGPSLSSAGFKLLESSDEKLGRLKQVQKSKVVELQKPQLIKAQSGVAE